MALFKPYLIQWQCWISFLRLVCVLMLCITSLMGLIFSGAHAGSSVAQMSLWTIFWSIMLINDIFMLTFDFKRTYTYAGCVAAQAGLNFCFAGVTTTYIALSIMYTGYGPSGIPVLLAGVCSLCLLVLSLRPVFAFRSQVPMGHIWAFNIKDTLGEGFSPLGGKHASSMFGYLRCTPISHPITRLVVAFGIKSKMFVNQLLFRRVRPVESRMYAFTRNFFAVFAMGILLFRTISALLQAQNEIGTRLTSANCEGRASPSYSIGILMERISYDPRWETSTGQILPDDDDIDILVSASWSHPRRGQAPFGTRNCTIQWSQNSIETIGYSGPYAWNYQNRTVEFYGCPTHWTDSYRNYPQLLQQSTFSDVFVYHIEVRARTPNKQVLEGQIPYIWLLNSHEISSNFSNVNMDSFEIRNYIPPWELLAGSHIEADAKLITRRFISSSIMKDVVLNSEPLYKPLSLYPIAESSVTPLNSSRASGATATIHTSLTPGLLYLRSQADALNPLSRNVCDFIDEYRSGSMFDVVGSVGGLFALLQAVHLLLFGRPMFWGLTGAKLITPFGLLGKCGSRRFKRRLKDEYHFKSAEDGSETIQIVKFLRDFVIEFGPADLDPESHPLQQPAASTTTLVAKEGDGAGIRIPLMRMDSGKTLAQKNDETDDEVKRSHSHINSV